jgi:hypothetical protein
LEERFVVFDMGLVGHIAVSVKRTVVEVDIFDYWGIVVVCRIADSVSIVELAGTVELAGIVVAAGIGSEWCTAMDYFHYVYVLLQMIHILARIQRRHAAPCMTDHLEFVLPIPLVFDHPKA